MTRHENNTSVPYGMYLSTRPVDLRFVGTNGGQLHGRDDATYSRIPAPIAIALAPAVGGAFVFAFPTLILVAAAVAVWRFATGKVQAAADQHAFLARSRFQPAGAYLKGQDSDGQQASDADMAALEDEVASRRDDER